MKRAVLAVILSILCSLAWAETQTFYARVTSLDEDNVYEAVPDRVLYGSRPVGYLLTQGCHHRATDEPATITATREPDRAWLTFSAGDVCEVIRVSMDRGSLSH